ncbi:MAG: PorP/SprF family type IX secretion system membrane protein [Bacteroidia bacterium]|nr:PorP/SprF family type IX secretion system membrane protein [Bacteroidia bacterium]
MIKHFFILFIILINVFFCCAQDIHFSQFNNSPLMINPALSGEFQGKGRFILNCRNQWKSITKNSFKTYSFSTDYSFLKEKLSTGLFVFKDIAGDGNMSISQINLSVASKVQINKTNYLKIGIQGAWSQKHFDANKLTWNSQYDGNIINPNLYSGEVNYQENYNFLDITTGVLWTHRFKNKTKFNIGLSAFHVNKPKYNFLSDVEKLNIRWCGHADVSFLLSPNHLTLFPSILIMKQGPSKEINTGAIIKYNLGNNSRYTGVLKSSSVFFGAYYRFNDAIITYTRFNYRNQLDICITYDINVSNFAVASNARGGLEISLIYIIPEKALIKLLRQ